MSDNTSKSSRPRLRVHAAGTPPEAGLSPDEARQEDEPIVRMLFPHALVLTNDAHERVAFPKGLVDVPAHLADHWYLEKNGVTRAAGVVAGIPPEEDPTAA